MKWALLFLGLLAGVSGCNSHAAMTPDQLNREALEILQAAPSEEDIARALTLTEKAIEIDPAHQASRNTRVNIFMIMKRMDLVAEEAEQLLVANNIAENHLYLCMAREVAEPGYVNQIRCYEQVAQRMEAEGKVPESDGSYLMALKLANSPQFEASLWEYLESQESEFAREMAEFLFLESSRDDVLREFFDI